MSLFHYYKSLRYKIFFQQILYLYISKTNFHKFAGRLTFFTNLTLFRWAAPSQHDVRQEFLSQPLTPPPLAPHTRRPHGGLQLPPPHSPHAGLQLPPPHFLLGAL